GMYIVNKIKEEFPEIFDANTLKEIQKIVKDSIQVESEILDWIFQEGEIETVNKKDLLNFMKYRVDNSLQNIGLERIYHVPEVDYLQIGRASCRERREV